jgi:hypothetical protein
MLFAPNALLTKLLKRDGEEEKGAKVAEEEVQHLHPLT